MAVKLKVTATEAQRIAITEWLETVSGQYWWIYRGDVVLPQDAALRFLPYSTLTFRRDVDAYSFYMAWQGEPDVWIATRT